MFTVQVIKFVQWFGRWLVRLVPGECTRTQPPHRLASVDRRVLRDVGISLGEILSVPRSIEDLRRPPHV